VVDLLAVVHSTATEPMLIDSDAGLSASIFVLAHNPKVRLLALGATCVASYASPNGILYAVGLAAGGKRIDGCQVQRTVQALPLTTKP
jgi:hypothetical protein